MLLLESQFAMQMQAKREQRQASKLNQAGAEITPAKAPGVPHDLRQVTADQLKDVHKKITAGNGFELNFA